MVIGPKSALIFYLAPPLTKIQELDRNVQREGLSGLA